MSDIFPIPLPYNTDWKPIDSAPKNGELIQGLSNTKSGFSLFRCFYKNGEWRELNFKGIEHPTHWRENLPEDRKP